MFIFLWPYEHLNPNYMTDFVDDRQKLHYSPKKSVKLSLTKEDSLEVIRKHPSIMTFMNYH